ncbi:unnamed protein product [Linum trigynum]|uniref:Uncharacterized protein n=1 Tax=Linum trigynum TaxID=586398 RepID=A0AAV2DVX6_9ROSI
MVDLFQRSSNYRSTSSTCNLSRNPNKRLTSRKWKFETTATTPCMQLNPPSIHLIRYAQHETITSGIFN